RPLQDTHGPADLGAGDGIAPRRGRGRGARPDMKPNRSLVEQIADAVLYEGYILYPYRPSVKNRQRWTFGGLYPRAFCLAQETGDAWSMQTECLLRGCGNAVVQIE